jgi:hypothetical protein
MVAQFELKVILMFIYVEILKSENSAYFGNLTQIMWKKFKIGFSKEQFLKIQNEKITLFFGPSSSQAVASQQHCMITFISKIPCIVVFYDSLRIYEIKIVLGTVMTISRICCFISCD